MKQNANRFTASLFVTLIFGFSFLFFALPDHSFSEQENRSLRTLPRFGMEKLISGEYSEQINDYFADQFPARDWFVGIKGTMEILLGKGENNGILLGKNGQLAQRLFDVRRSDGGVITDTDGFDREAVKIAVEGINRANKALDVPFSVLLTGRTIDVTASSFAYPAAFGEELRAIVKDALNPDVSYIDTIPLLAKKHSAGESVYYQTDHHWTTRGAYYAYCEVMRSFGMGDAILPEDAFDRKTVSQAFYGTAWSAGGMKFVSPDTIEFWLKGNEDSFLVTADGKAIDGFYSYGYLDQKDQYSAFLDGTHDVVTVTKADGMPRPKLLMLKDSFANSLAPFLAQHFDLVLLNLSSVRTDYTNVSEYAASIQADRVLLVYTLENVIGATKLQKLR